MIAAAACTEINKATGKAVRLRLIAKRRRISEGFLAASAR